MIKLTNSEDRKIRNQLDFIAHNLHHNVVVFEDMCWAHQTIKNLLFIIDELQRELKYSGTGT